MIKRRERWKGNKQLNRQGNSQTSWNKSAVTVSYLLRESIDGILKSIRALVEITLVAELSSVALFHVIVHLA